MKTVGFYSPHLCVRGTEVAMFDYAYYNQTILGNRSIILYHRDDPRNDLQAINKFSSEFHVVPLHGFEYDKNNVSMSAPAVNQALEHALSTNSVGYLYLIKGGWNDGVLPQNVKTLVHCIACADYHKNLHGDLYAYGSEWLSAHCSDGKAPVIPYIVDLPLSSSSFRSEFNIPENSVVFGRHGGYETFDLHFVKKVIPEILRIRSDIWFLFLNTQPFISHERCIFLPRVSSLDFKASFIHTCDYMLHARYIGESFGLACAEFSFSNKQVLTWSKSPERHHIETLGPNGILYKDTVDIFDHLLSLGKPAPGDYNSYRKYSPVNVMESFNKLFLSL